MAGVRWLRSAWDGLDEATHYIAKDSRRLGEVFARRVFVATDRLETFSLLGRMVPEYGRPDVREVIVATDRIVYQLVGSHVEIVAVRYGARLLGSWHALNFGAPTEAECGCVGGAGHRSRASPSLESCRQSDGPLRRTGAGRRSGVRANL